MQMVPAGIELSFEVTFDADALDVAMSVYDDSGVSPVLVQGPSAMDVVVGNTYRGKFTPDLGKVYLIHKAVYTDGTFSTLDDTYAQGSETIVAVEDGTAISQIMQKQLSQSSCDVVALAAIDDEVIAVLDDC